MSYLIIGDIAGRYDELMILLARATERDPTAHVIAVGDLIDRGSQSKEVIEFFMDRTASNKATVLLGNHEHMLLDYYLKTNIYQCGVYRMNGGEATLQSFGGEIPRTVIDWMRQLPYHKWLFDKKILVTHSFLPAGVDIKQALKDLVTAELTCSTVPYSDRGLDLLDQTLIWTRYRLTKRDYFQIFGHNSPMGLQVFQEENGEKFALCIDDSRHHKLTGVHVPSSDPKTFTVYQQDYL